MKKNIIELRSIVPEMGLKGILTHPVIISSPINIFLKNSKNQNQIRRRKRKEKRFERIRVELL